MGFDASHKSHCQGFPTDPVLCLGGSCCQGHLSWVLGDREAHRDNWPEEQGLAACEQGPQQVVFTVAKFRPLDPISQAAAAHPALLPGQHGCASPWAPPPVPTELKQLIPVHWLSSAGTGVQPPRSWHPCRMTVMTGDLDGVGVGSNG